MLTSSSIYLAVVIMFEPRATMELYRWWMGCGYRGNGPCAYESSQKSKEMEKMYPQLARARSKGLIEPFATLRMCLADPLLEHASPEAREAFSKISASGPNYPLRGGASPAADQFGDDRGGAFAYLLTRRTQEEVLSWFPPSLHSRIATWQVTVPPECLRHLAIGFYPEREHEIWRQRYVSRASRGVVASMGLIVNPSIQFSNGGGVEIASHDAFHGENHFVLSPLR